MIQETGNTLSEVLMPKNPMNDPLVTIITPVWDKAQDLLTICIPSVRAQTYKYIEHVVVGDGIDFALRRELDRIYYFHNYVELGRRWSKVDSDAPEFTAAKEVGLYLAKGEYVLLLDAGEKLATTAIETLVGKIKNTEKQAVSDKGRTLYRVESTSAAIL